MIRPAFGLGRTLVALLLGQGLLLFVGPEAGAQGIAALCNRSTPGERERISIDVIYFQGPCNKKLVKGKDATVRVYVNWRAVSPRYSVEKYDVEVDLVGEGEQPISCHNGPRGPVTVMRPDLYTPSEIRSARNSVNFFGCNLENHSEIKARVMIRDVDIYGGATGEPVLYHGIRAVAHMSTSDTIRALVVFPTVGRWSEGVPLTWRLAMEDILASGRAFALQNLPVAEVELDILQVDLKLEDPAFLTTTFGYEKLYLEWLHLKLNGLGGAHLVIAWVPQEILGEGVFGLTNRFSFLPRGGPNTLEVGGRNQAVILLREGAEPSTFAHELGHYLGLPHHDGSPGARAREIEGFRSTSTGGSNKSYVEGNGENPQQLVSLMTSVNPGPDALRIRFIMNAQYEALQNDMERRPLPRSAMRSGEGGGGVEAARRAQTGGIAGGFGDEDAGPAGGPSAPPSHQAFGEPGHRTGAVAAARSQGMPIRIEGLLAPDGEAGELGVIEWTPVPGREDAGQLAAQEPAVASLHLVDAGGRVLASTPLAASLRSGADDETPDEGAFRFVVSMMQPEGTRALRLVSRNGNVLAERRASTEGIHVRILAPTVGEAWEAGRTIRWEADGPEAEGLRYSVHYSRDGGARWWPLALQVASTSLETGALEPGSDPILVVAVTNGFDVAVDTVSLRPRVPPRPMGSFPAQGDTVRPDATVLVTFSSVLAESSARGEVLRLLDDRGDLVPTETRRVQAGRALELVPRHPLQHGAVYTVVVGGNLSDPFGNRAEGEVRWGFHVEPDVEPPRVEQTVPRDGAVAIPPDLPIRIQFTEAMDPATLDGIRVERDDGAPVATSLTWDAETRTVILISGANLEARTTYRVTVPVTLRDPAGNALAVEERWSFRTR